MKCAKCGAELPANTRFCSGCGAALAASTGAQPVAAAQRAVAASDSIRRKRILTGVGMVALLILAALGYKLLMGGLLSAQGTAPAGPPLTTRVGTVPKPAPVTSATGPVAPGAPQDVLDYLAFLKDIERQRIMLAKRHVSKAVVISTTITAGNLTAQMSDEPEKATGQAYNQFQELLATVSSEWQQLSAQFLSVNPPSTCKPLHDRYYEVLRQTTAGVTNVATSMAQALSGDPSKAIESLTAMQGAGMGSASRSVTDACKAADQELGAVCGKFGIRKDFDIQDDSSGASLLGQ